MYSFSLQNQYSDFFSFSSNIENLEKKENNDLLLINIKLSSSSILNSTEKSETINLKKRKFEQLESSSEKLKKRKLLENEALTFKEFPSINSKKFYKELRENNPITKMLDYSPLCCRFNDIPCPKETHFKFDHEKSDLYLHANHVILNDRQFIATQYPMIYEAMDFKLCESFWKMSTTSCLIVDLTNSSDHNKGLTKYAPEEEDDELGFGNTFVVCNKKESVSSLNSINYRYSIETGEDESFSIDRLHFKNWPDQNAIGVDELDRLVDFVNDKHKNQNQSIIIHCRAGVGRTGTLMVACAMKPMILNGTITSENLKETMEKLILSGRSQRGPHFVQTISQLQLLCEWAESLLQN